MNEHLTELNGGKSHKPIYKVREKETIGLKFNIGTAGFKNKKFVEADKGTNLFYAVYADNVIESGTFGSACSDTLGIREKLTVSGGNNTLVVTDNRGQNISISYNPAGNTKMVNQMTRDYVFNAVATKANTINTSSFAVVHQISTPLNRHKDSDRYDDLWTGAGARQKMSAYRRLYDNRLYKQY